jgi:DNA repair exonuclease SbcCD ATPase subunit
MKILSVNINNFLAIGKAIVPLADRGLVLIQGDNQDETSADSNGAGKSSFADAICWCLYGTTARGEEGDRVVNRFKKKDCCVVVTVQDGDLLYTITRYRKHKTGKNGLTVGQKDAAGTDADLTLGTEKLTQEVVNKIIGCSYEVFCGAVYAGQERMPDLPGMTDKALKMLIEEASGATLLEAAYVEANTRLAGKKSELTSISNKIDALKGQVSIISGQITADTAAKAAFENNRVVKAAAHFEKAKASKLAFVAKTDEIGTHPKITEIQAKINACDAAIAAVTTEQVQERALDDELKAAVRTETLLTSALSRANNDLVIAKKALVALDHKVGCPCGTCARPYAVEDIAPAKALAETQVQAASDEAIDAKARADLASLDVLKRTDALKAYRASMTDLSATNAQRTSLAASLATVEKLYREHGALGIDYANHTNNLKAVKAEVNPFIASMVRNTMLCADLAKHTTEYEAAFTAKTAELRVAEAVSRVFSPAGVRAFLLDEVTPFLNDQTAKYLGTLSDGHIQATWSTLIKNAKGELREKFSIEVTTSTGGETFKGISGGEKRKVRIACALALQDLVARRATKPIELFIGDEIDDALDAAGIERLRDILDEKARERGSVFIISHSDLKDLIRNTIIVTKKDEMATLEERVS